MCRILNYIQLTDGRGIVNIDLDDAARFRLDTMATHQLQNTPCVGGMQAPTTFTDDVNEYPSSHQVSLITSLAHRQQVSCALG